MVITDVIFNKFTKPSANQRRYLQTRRYHLYHDYIEQYYLDEVHKRFQNYKNRLSLKKFADFSNNSIKLIIDRLACVYKEPTIRVFKDDSNSTELFNNVCPHDVLDLVMQKVNALTLLENECFVKPVWTGNEIELQIIPAHQVEVYNIGQNIYGLGHQVNEILPDGTTHEGYEIWTRDNKYYVNTSGTITYEEPNLYNTIPFVLFQNGYPVNSFWLPETQGEDLVSLYFDQILIRSWVNAIMYHQSFKQVYIKPTDDDLSVRSAEELDVKIGFGSYIPREAGTLDLVTNVENHMKVIEAKMARVASNYSISESVLNQSKLSSGLERLLAHSGLNSVRRQTIKYFSRKEKKLMSLIALIWNIHNPTIQFPDELKPIIDYGEEQLIDTPLEEIKLSKELLDLNLTNYAELYMKRNPDITSQNEAMEIIRKNMEVNTEVKEIMLKYNNNSGLQDFFGAIGGKISNKERDGIYANNNSQGDPDKKNE